MQYKKKSREKTEIKKLNKMEKKKENEHSAERKKWQKEEQAWEKSFKAFITSTMIYKW